LGRLNLVKQLVDLDYAFLLQEEILYPLGNNGMLQLKGQTFFQEVEMWLKDSLTEDLVQDV
jgi:hypothetical protein